VRGRSVALASWTGVLFAAAGLCPGQQVLYGGNQYLQVDSVNSGWLVRVDALTGVVIPIGQPAGVARLPGVAFDADGTLWAASLSGTPSGTLRSSTLLRLDPTDGSILETIGAIVDSDGGEPVGIENLAIQPGTQALLGTRGISDQNRVHAADIYRIDKGTGVATLFIDNNNGFQEASIAFAPDGRLYQSISTCCAPFGGNPKFQTLDPVTGAVLTTVLIPNFFKAMAVREDGTLFAAVTPDIESSTTSEIYVVDPATGSRELVGSTGDNPIGGLAFGPPAAAGPCIREPHTLCLNGNRFAASVTYRTNDGRSGDATGVALTPDSGYFWFFDPANIEVVVKVLQACSLGGHYWVFAAGLTNVEVILTVVDTETGARKEYPNPLGQAFPAIQDTSAFATCP
jgi:hypothetical protein